MVVPFFEIDDSVTEEVDEMKNIIDNDSDVDSNIDV